MFQKFFETFIFELRVQKISLFKLEILKLKVFEFFTELFEHVFSESLCCFSKLLFLIKNSLKETKDFPGVKKAYFISLLVSFICSIVLTR